MKTKTNPGYSIVSEWGSEAAAKKALGVARKKGGASGLAYKQQFGKHLLVKSKRRNPGEEDAAAMYEEFHGRAPEFIEEIDYQSHSRVHMAELGQLKVLVIALPSGEAYKLSFKGVVVACSPNGGQLYFVKGDQNVDLEVLGLGDTLPKDQIDLGECRRIEYETQKGFHDFLDVDYWHNFGEEDGRFPTLHFDVLNRALYLSGGAYQVRPEGIVN